MTQTNTAAGSTVKAGGHVHIQATQGDLKVQGSTLQADQNLTLAAAQNLQLLASADTETNRSTNKSSSTSFGVSFGVGSGGAGFSVDLAASRGKGQANSDSTTWNNTQVQAGERLTLSSGSDTTLLGAVARGEQIVVNVGTSGPGNLVIESLQDTATSQASQSTSGVAFSVPIGVGRGSASISQAQQRSNSHYQSVNGQSGLKAGDGGFQVNVAGATVLKGAVIVSSDQAVQNNQNRLSSQTLSTSELQNRMNASASSSGASVGTNMLNGKYELGKMVAGNALNRGKASQSDNGTTQSVISGAQVTVGSQTTDTRQVGLTDSNGKTVSSDTAHTHRALAKADVAGLQQQAQQQQSDRVLVFNAATAFTDSAFKKMFLTEAKMYTVSRDEAGKPVVRELSPQEKANLQPGPDGKVHIANNGIFNGSELDPSAAAKYAEQNGGAAYFIHFPQASNAVSELLIAGYQKYLEGDALGLTNATQEVKNVMYQYGQTGLQLDGHSRGSMTIGNAMESLAKEPGAQGALSNTTVNFYGPAYNAQQADELLSWLQNRSSMTPDEKARAMLMFQNHNADPVGGLPMVGNNPGTGGTLPQGSSRLREQIRAVTGQKDTVHNCYGSAPGKCEEFWENDPNKRPVLQPARPELLNKRVAP